MRKKKLLNDEYNDFMRQKEGKTRDNRKPPLPKDVSNLPRLLLLYLQGFKLVLVLREPFFFLSDM